MMAHVIYLSNNIGGGRGWRESKVPITQSALPLGGRMAQARRLLASASCGPETLRVIFQAFDEAWAAIAPRYGEDQSGIEAARAMLADIVLSLARDETRDAGMLRDAALALFSERGCLRPVRPGAQSRHHIQRGG
jgi:hypothetical protein